MRAGRALPASYLQVRPLPANQAGKLWMLYRVLNSSPLNWKYTARAAAALCAGTATSGLAALAPAAGPSSVVTTPKDITK
jgi:hypothetical protein